VKKRIPKGVLGREIVIEEAPRLEKDVPIQDDS
jgi:hypothetical protein